jgi:drug/metabolite transporter (DMT)-like permease
VPDPTTAHHESEAEPGPGTRRWSPTRRMPGCATAVGALLVSTSAVLIQLAHTSPAAATFYRCVLALPFLLVPAVVERRSKGQPGRREHGLAIAAGVLFAGDMLLWTQAITELGAGLSTVLVNVQVVLVPLLAWLVDRERVSTRFLMALPVLLIGVALSAGVVQQPSGTHPIPGTVHALLAAGCYSGFLFLMRRVATAGRTIQCYAEVTMSAAAVALVTAVGSTGFALAVSWHVLGWLLLVAVTGQVLGWLLVALSATRLPSHTGAALLLLTPAGAVLLGALILGEHPAFTQLTGCALILASAYFAVTTRNP